MNQNCSNSFKVEGPHGIPLQIRNRNVAFAAGTGVLPFLDLIKVMLENNQVKFDLHVSFTSEEEAIGLRLLKAAADRLRDQFKLAVRYSD